MLTKGDKIIAGTGTITPLLTSIWSDHILNDISWLRADTFSWQSGDVYTAAYQHLLADINGKEPQSETIGDITIEFYLANDGHKITTDEESVASIYTATGVAWYYVIDTANRRFKLPRTKFGFTGLRTKAGDYVEAGLPNITGMADPGMGSYRPRSQEGALYWDETRYGTTFGGNSGSWVSGWRFDASRSNPIYGNSNTVQTPATQMYLYFYVGQFTQTATEQTAGLNTEMFNDLNSHKVVEFQEPTAENGYTWYRKYADGWVEQGGPKQSGVGQVTLPIVMANNAYQVYVTGGDNNYNINYIARNRATTTVYITARTGAGADYDNWYGYWLVCGMAA